MSVPSPQKPLDGHCSAINNEILYVVSSTSFQSLPLSEKSQWKTLPQGQAVTNPACVLVTPSGDASKASLYVIGGTSQDSSYTGIQRFDIASGQWETLHPPTSDMVNRTNHSAVYMPGMDSILVYAGSQPQAPSDYSSQTFVLSLTTPYGIKAFTSAAPPSNQPILLPFDQNNAILMGSNTRPKEVWTFNATSGWNKYPTQLATAIKAGVRGLIVDGSDGSKVLATYDMTVSPNVVDQIVLASAGGAAPATALSPNAKVPVTKVSPGLMMLHSRDLTLSNWPAYNSTDAPTSVRSDYAVSQDQTGLAVITGGSEDDPINIFNNNGNAWVDNGLFFTGKANGNQVTLTPAEASSSASAAASSTAQPTSTTTPTAAPAVLPGTSNKPKMLRILGITLGVLFGIAAIFIIALLLLRYRRQKKRQKQQYINEKADRMSFQDRGAAVMTQPDGSLVDVSRIPPNHRFTQHNTSHSSFAMVAGKLGRGASRNKLAPTDGRGSSESTRQLVKPRSSPRKADISRPYELDTLGNDKEVFVPATSASGAPQIPASTLTSDKVRSTGWSRYFAGDALPSAYANRGPTVSTYTVGTEMTLGSPVPPLPTSQPLTKGQLQSKDRTVSTYTAATEMTLGEPEPPLPTSQPLAKGSLQSKDRTVSAYTVATEMTLGSPVPPLPTSQPLTRGQLQSKDRTVSAYTVGTEMTFGEPEPPLPSAGIPSSIIVPAPLFGNKNQETERISRVIARSPGFNNSVEDLARRGSSIEATRGQRADIFGDGKSLNRRASMNSISGLSDGSYFTEDSDFDSSGYFDQTRSSTASNWTPMDNQYEIKPNNTASVGSSPDPNLGSFNPRAPSSTYTASYYGGPESRIVSTRGKSALFPSIPERDRPSSSGGVRSPLNSQLFPAPPVPEDKNTLGVPGEGQGRESTLTMFPKGVPSAYYASRNAAKDAENVPKQDMSWLNLGLK
ncbi:hypothetical protein K461DRAFT_159509 [Myriangium duriaei CBS 260.36]|uniref:Pre-mRNA splicing factor CLF1 n=1 Tax=Myriangium duriaei CBS 260.36 TaxID=1168546 RepID=A0A9P4IXZ8_9PEZI|nr:hypothetical protein K461DRAFT_159509 [Myriangium duriaei CBS 260.36]